MCGIGLFRGVDSSHSQMATWRNICFRDMVSLREVGFSDDRADQIHLNVAGAVVESLSPTPPAFSGRCGEGIF